MVMEFEDINGILNNKYYAIPDYQRDYEWTAKENGQLIEDVLLSMREDDLSKHYLGTIVLADYEEEMANTMAVKIFDYKNIKKSDVSHIIDGQQRLTSFSLLLKVAGDMIEADPDLDMDSKNMYANKLLRNCLFGTETNSNHKPAPHIILNGNTGRLYTNILCNSDKLDVNKRYRGAKRLDAAKKLFENELQSEFDNNLDNYYNGSKNEFYMRLALTLGKNMQFSEIKCERKSDDNESYIDPFQVFESLNGKGLKITAADRIKNLLMSWNAKSNNKVDNIANVWFELEEKTGREYLEDFFVSLLFFTEKRRTSKNDLPNKFTKNYRNVEINKLLKMLISDGMLYNSIRECTFGNLDAQRYLEDIKNLGSSQAYIILFSVLKKFKDDKFIKQQAELIRAVLNIVVRMQVCESNPNKFDTISSLCIDKLNNDATIEEIVSILNGKLLSIASDQIFEERFKDFAPDKNQVSMVYLKSLEEFRRKEMENRSPVSDANLSVEHIIPLQFNTLDYFEDKKDEFPDEIQLSTDFDDENRKAFNDMVVQRIGNKMILYTDDNTSASNKTYTEKMSVYKSGAKSHDKGTPYKTFQLAKDLCDNYTDNVFGYNDLLKRSAELASYARKIWGVSSK